MKKSKEYLLHRPPNPYYSLELKAIGNGHIVRTFCKSLFMRHFGTWLKPGETKRIRITIEEVK